MLSPVKATAEQADAFRKATGGPEVRFPRVWLDDAQVEITNDDFIKGLIGKRSLVVVYGPSGDGKTFFTMDLVLHIVTAAKWRGRRVRPGLWIYVAAEAGSSVLRRFCGVRDKRLSEAREGRTPLAIVTRGVNLLDDVEVAALLAELKAISDEAELPLGGVVFDTFSRSIPGGDENAAQDVTRAIAAADRIRDTTGATTVFVHHSGKDVARGARGHSALYAAADAVIQVANRTATIEKCRDGITGEAFAFDLEVLTLGEDSDGDPVTTCIVVPKDAPTAQTRPTRELPGAAKVALTALRESISDHGRVMGATSTIPQGVKAVELDRWRSQFKIRYGDDEREAAALKKAFQRGKEALAKAQMIGVSDPYVWLLEGTR